MPSFFDCCSWCFGREERDIEEDREATQPLILTDTYAQKRASGINYPQMAKIIIRLERNGGFWLSNDAEKADFKDWKDGMFPLLLDAKNQFKIAVEPGRALESFFPNYVTIDRAKLTPHQHEIVTKVENAEIAEAYAR